MDILPADTNVGVVPTNELVVLCALDTELYNRTFFPNTFRQPSPKFHREIDELLENRAYRHIAVEVFRGGAKTTKLRAYTSKRIAYGTSRTILFVSASQSHSEKSLAWLRKNVEFNRMWAQTYGLRKGSKWTGDVIEIEHVHFGRTTTVIALGITGQIRGINVDDYRPDLIVIDDCCDEENTSTPDQRAKTEKLVFGALDKSLTPSSECPDSKMIFLQTPLHMEDLINKCKSDPSWKTASFSCFDENGLSRWPERFPTEVLYAEKDAHAQRGQLLLWLREMECRVMNEETASFRREWINYYDTVPENIPCFIAIDPVPPPSDRALLSGRDSDFEVIAVVGVHSGNYYLLDISSSRGHTPEWTVMEFFRLIDKWRPLKGLVEGVAYQRTLKWVLEKAMSEKRRFLQIEAVTDRRNKAHRILQAFSGIASQHRFFLPKDRTRDVIEFESQFVSYPQVKHDDHLDAVAMAISSAIEFPLNEVEVVPNKVPQVQEGWRACP